MRFKNRVEAGVLLAFTLEKYQRKKNVIVYGVPRGGVVTAVQIAGYLHAPLDLVIVRKIGHPFNPEYAIAAVSEHGQVVEKTETGTVDSRWLALEIKKEREEVKRRQEKYLQRRKPLLVKGKIAVLADDGVATGLSLKAAIGELRRLGPKELVLAVPIIPESVAAELRKKVDRLVSLVIPADEEFPGAVSVYYDDFAPVSDEEVLDLLKAFKFL